MAVVENITTADGDVLIIKTDVPIVGIIALYSFTDTVTGESEFIYFEKTFRYSINGGLSYSDWLDLTTINISNIVVERIDYFIIEYRYKRIGAGTPDPAFVDLTINGIVNPLEYPVYQTTIFKDFFTPNDANVLGWAINVLEKLYKSGIIASYIPRNKGGDDSDYIAHWFTVTHFFAILVYYARGFESTSSNTDLMREFVKSRGVYMSDNPDVEELYYIYNNYIDEIKRRGTRRVFTRQMTAYDINGGQDLTDYPINGEMLRILNTLVTDEFLFAYTSRGELGWCIGQSSPLYTGANNIKNLIKAYEYTEEVLDLSKYPFLYNEYISLVSDKMRISNIAANSSDGIGPPLEDLTDTSKAILIYPTLDYEISFRITQSDLTTDIYFGVALYDINRNFISTLSIVDGSPTNTFFTTIPPKADTEYWIRGVIYSKDADNIPGDVITFGFGANLKFPEGAVYLIPIIQISNGTGSTAATVIDIWDIKVRPAALWFSRGTLSARNFIIGYLKNNSANYNNTQVEKIINNELVPYNTYPVVKFAPFTD